MKRICCVVLVMGIAVPWTDSALAQPLVNVYQVTPDLPGLQNEEQIFICRDDTNRVLINHRDFRLGYRQIGLGHGLDIVGGGLLWFWGDTLVHPDFQVYNRQSDPVMTVNSDGDIIICHLDYQENDASDTSKIAFLVSQDCGDTWSGPFTVIDTIGQYFEDKQFITCDRSGGIYDGNVYVAWSRYTTTIEIMFARSTTNATTWDDAVTVGPANFVSCLGGELWAGQFAQPLVGDDGAVYVFWQGWDVDSTGGDCDFYTAIQMRKSTDGGVTWGNPSVIGRVSGWSAVDGGVDVYSQPTTAADMSGGPHTGNLYLQYRDTASNAFLESDIMFRRSLDGGTTWSDPIRVNDDPIGSDVDQFHNWMICTEEGILVSIWYDQRNDPLHTDFDVYAAYSFDGGATWTSNHFVAGPIEVSLLGAFASRSALPVQPHGPLDSQSPLSSRAGLIAEYIGVDCVHDKVVATWTGTNGGSPVDAQEVYFGNWYLTPMPPRLIAPVGGQAVTPGSETFKWATSWREDDDRYQIQIADDPAFTTIVRDMMVTVPSYVDALAGLDEQMWYWRVRVENLAATQGSGYSPVDSFYLQLNSCDCPFQADLNADEQPDVVDLNMLIDVLYFNAPDPQDAQCPTTRTNLNCDSVSDVIDLNYIIQLLFFNGPDPCDPCLP